MKKNSFLVLDATKVAMLSLALVLGLTFVGCATNGGTNNNDNDPRKDYFGTWITTDNQSTVTISADEVTFSISDGQFCTIKNPTWTAVINNTGQSEAEYPSGYEFSGIVADSIGFNPPASREGTEGAYVGQTGFMWCWISPDKQSLSFGGWAPIYKHGPFQHPFIKQP